MLWWEKYPGRLEKELTELSAFGVEPKIDKAAFGEGRLIIDIQLRIRTELNHAQIIFPDLYPYFRPHLFVAGLETDLRHYNPVSGNVCLLSRPTDNWHPAMTVASLFQSQLPRWEEAAPRDFTDQRLAIEDQQAEPINNYLGLKNPFQMIICDSSWGPPENADTGRMTVAIKGGSRFLLPHIRLAGWVSKLTADQEIDGAIKRILALDTYQEITASWIKFPSRGMLINSLSAYKDERQGVVDFIKSQYQPVWAEVMAYTRSNRPGLIGVTFPEESPTATGGFRYGWFFVAYAPQSLVTTKGKKHQRGAVEEPMCWFIGAENGGPEDFFQRIPEHFNLRDKKIAFFGLGCVGAPSALHLARAGVGELRFLDKDKITPGNLCRWPVGFEAIGRGKVEVITEYIERNYPFTRIGKAHYHDPSNNDFRMALGEHEKGFNERKRLEIMLDGVDLIFDATAEVGINHFLSDLALENNVPYIGIASRPGGWGGSVVRIRPNETEGCYVCYLHRLADGTIPRPAFDPLGDKLQPAGCADVTFTAAGFDVEEISLAGVRMAASTLAQNGIDAYPKITSDVAICSLRKEGNLTSPQWTSHDLLRHEDCRNCHK